GGGGYLCPAIRHHLWVKSAPIPPITHLHDPCLRIGRRHASLVLLAPLDLRQLVQSSTQPFLAIQSRPPAGCFLSASARGRVRLQFLLESLDLSFGLVPELLQTGTAPKRGRSRPGPHLHAILGHPL